MSDMPQSLERNELTFSTAFIALVVGAVGMGASPLFVRYAAAEVGPFASAFWRMALALPFLAIWLRSGNSAASATASPVKPSVLYPVLAGLAFTGDLFFWHLSILSTSVANATFFATLMPVFVIGITWLALRQPVARSAFVGVFVCLVGGGILVGKTMSVNPEYLRGDIYGIITALFFGLYFLAIGHARQQGGAAARITLIQTGVTAAALLVIAAAHSWYAGVGFFPVSLRGIAALLGLALVSQVAGQGLMTVSLGRLPTVFSSLVIFIEAIAAAMLGWVFLGERLSAAQAVGGILILIGIAVAKPGSSSSGAAQPASPQTPS
ncbi:MAG: DMT family transporter [Planctomycetaceae bacterium]|nr:DMT family transporter [Planctomycetaceae bacterium]